MPGERIELNETGKAFTLFFPPNWSNAPVSNVAAHFHTVASSVIPWHLQRGTRDPLVVFAWGSGSAAYRAPLEDTNFFGRVLARVEQEIRARGVKAQISGVDVSSFSAGYGAVRELVKSPRYFSLLRRVVLLDSIYGGLVPQPNGKTNRVVDPAHVDVWLTLAKAAVRGEKTLVITLSDVQPVEFASSVEVTTALLERLGLQLTPSTHSNGAGPDEFPLVARADAGRFHAWRYAGTNAVAHMAHVRHMADVWRAIE